MAEPREGKESITEVQAKLVFTDGFERHFDVALFPEMGTGAAPDAPKPVRELLLELLRAGALATRQKRDAGRALTRGPYAAARELIDAHPAMGLGKLAQRATENNMRKFDGEGLLDCEVTLGYCEGVASAQAGKPALGAEIACQRKGAARCVFVVRSR